MSIFLQNPFRFIQQWKFYGGIGFFTTHIYPILPIQSPYNALASQILDFDIAETCVTWKDEQIPSDFLGTCPEPVYHFYNLWDVYVRSFQYVFNSVYGSLYGMVFCTYFVRAPVSSCPTRIRIRSPQAKKCSPTQVLLFYGLSWIGWVSCTSKSI